MAKNLKMKSARAALDMSQDALAKKIVVQIPARSLCISPVFTYNDVGVKSPRL